VPSSFFSYDPLFLSRAVFYVARRPQHPEVELTDAPGDVIWVSPIDLFSRALSRRSRVFFFPRSPPFSLAGVPFWKRTVFDFAFLLFRFLGSLSSPEPFFSLSPSTVFPPTRTGPSPSR